MGEVLAHLVLNADLEMYVSGELKFVEAKCGLIFAPMLPLNPGTVVCRKCDPIVFKYAISA